MHPLLSTLVRSKATPDVRPSAAEYDVASGLWMGVNGPVSDDPNRMPDTKKNDLETGEDQKGQ